VALVALLLLLAGVMGYRRAAARNAGAADCADKPKPANEFAMAAECDGGAAPAAPATTKPATAPAPK
jgi:hypothetical protein